MRREGFEAEFLELWGRWTDSFNRDVTLETHADIDAEFRNFARDEADSVAAALRDALQAAEVEAGERRRAQERIAALTRELEAARGKPCDHAHWTFATHGRICSCGVHMADFGD